MGDFNIDTLVSNKACEIFRNMVETLDLKLLDIGIPTKITETTKTSFDHVLISSTLSLLMHLLKNVI